MFQGKMLSRVKGQLDLDADMAARAVSSWRGMKPKYRSKHGQKSNPINKSTQLKTVFDLCSSFPVCWKCFTTSRVKVTCTTTLLRSYFEKNVSLSHLFESTEADLDDFMPQAD